MQDLYSVEIKTVAQNTSWPSPQDYNEAIQNPQFAFADLELKNSEPELNIIGIPKPASGNFASVYRLFSNDSEWAVRCFLQPMSDQQQRYEALSKKLKECNLPYMCSFEYLSEGIRVHKNWFPIIKMEWVKGKSLLEYISEHINNSRKLEELANSFEELITSLDAAGIAHGDLQHGNILVTDEGQIKLVDYDGCFVPALRGCKSNELGHRNYQHPKRDAEYFNEKIDLFSAQIILLSLRAIASEPSLWSKLDGGDECLLFRRLDLSKPNFSKTFHLLEIQHDDSIKALAKQVRYELGQELSDLPDFGTINYKQSGLAPLETILVNTTDGSASAKSRDNHAHVIAGRKSRKKTLDERTSAIVIFVLIVLGAAEFRALTNILSDMLKKNMFRSVEFDPYFVSKERVSSLLQATEFNRAQEEGVAPTEDSFSLSDTPIKLYKEAKANHENRPELAEKKYLRALELDGHASKSNLSADQRADALQFIGMNRLNNQDESSTVYIEQAYEILNADSNFREASRCITEYADAMVTLHRYEQGYLQAIVGLENSSTVDTYRPSLCDSATTAAIGTYGNDPYNAQLKLKRIWKAISKSKDPNLELRFLAQLDEFAEELLSGNNLKGAYDIFNLIASLAQSDDLHEFKVNALNRLEQIFKR